jgi:hypothetical protein
MVWRYGGLVTFVFYRKSTIKIVFTKYLLKIPLITPSSIIYGEIGRYPLEIEIKARMVTYWSRLFSSEVEKWSYIMCRITNEHLEKGYLNTWWSATIRHILNQCGVGVIWNNPGTMSPRHSKLVVVQKLKDQFVHKWRADDITVDQRLQSYCVIKGLLLYGGLF